MARISQKGLTELVIDFEWYRSFIAIYKHNSVSEAAKTRIMTQPAMSQHLASLEAEVGEPLFTRTARKMIPTERGKELYSQLAPLMESLEQTTMGLKFTSLPTMQVLKVGTCQELFIEKILPNLPDSGINTVSYFGMADQLLEQLKEDKIDIILTSQKFLTPGIEYVPLMEETFVIVAPKKMEVPEISELEDREQWLSEQQWLSYGLELPIIRRFWREYFKKRPLIKPAHVIPSLQVMLNAIGCGAGISLLPTYLLNQQHESEPGWKTVFDDMMIRNALWIGYKSKHKHMLAINEWITLLCEQTEG